MIDPLKMPTQPWFRYNMCEYYCIDNVNQDLVSNLVHFQQKQRDIIRPLGWLETSSFLESVAMLISEYQEAHDETDKRKAHIEIVDCILRTIVLTESIRLKTNIKEFMLSNIIRYHTVLDIRHDFLAKDKPAPRDWLYALFLKTSRLVNMLRGESFEEKFVPDFICVVHQILYMCFLYIDHDYQQATNDKYASGFKSSFLTYLYGLITYKIDHNAKNLPLKHRYK